MSERCSAIRKDGTPCGNKPLKGSDYCRWHQSNIQAPSFTFTWEVKPDLFQFLFEHANTLTKEQGPGMDLLILKSTFDDDALRLSHTDTPQEAAEGEAFNTMTLNVHVTFHRDPEIQDGICFVLGNNRVTIGRPDTASSETLEEQRLLLKTIEERNRKLGLILPTGVTEMPRPDVETVLPAQPDTDITEGRRLPPAESIPQYTFHEARTVAIAIADAHTGRRWEQIEGEIAVRHVIPGEPLQTKFAAGPLSGWWGSPLSHEGLLEELRKMEFSGVLLYHVGLHMVLQAPHVSVSLDDLIREIGWEPRSKVQRAEMRRRIWLWLTYFDGMKVIGRRPGRYRDPNTGRELNLTSVDALLRITGTRLPSQCTLDGTDIPIEVTITAGPWLDQYRGNRQVLSDFGNIRNIAAIPAGKPSGAWAQSIGLALYQRWRERATRAEVGYVGEDNHPTVRGQHFTRRDLLGLFRCDPYVEDVLSSKNPSRARQYWNDAIQELKLSNVIGYYREVEPLPQERQGWQERWLDQPLDIRPAQDGTQAIAEIARSVNHKRRAPRANKN
ncbi:MAG TPA: hypothetical protein VHV83_15155 [Armatimonadota bacterium]|nr:hypothetical protein [Armatimonadota bacterium]